MRHIISTILLGAVLAATPALAQSAGQSPDNPDPWESMNRKIFAFNETLDRWVLAPVAKGYQFLTPDFVDRGLTNMFDNLFVVNQLLNDALQGKFDRVAIDSGRFVINTTVGVVGFFDVAGTIGLAKQDEDFGQTFAVWGMGSGPYLVLPFFGASTVRDVLGMPLDSAANAINYIEHVPTRNTTLGVDFVDTRADLIAAEKLITGDRYAFIRNAYLQQREFDIKDGKIESDGFGDEEFDDWE